MDYIIFVLSSAGAAYIIAISRIFKNIKAKILGTDEDKLIVYFFNCPMCLGFWTSLIFSLTFFSLPYNSFLLACAVSCIIHLLWMISNKKSKDCGCGKSKLTE
jgi:amino acid permease|tara:strand:- start:2262 stop:2570 length:309 start_codon:yes stop_codon:yes gene_type:complete